MSPDPDPRVPWRRAAAPLALFLIGFAAAARAIHELTPRNPGREIGLRVERLRELEGAVDTLFIGSSRVQRGIDPRLFDACTAAAGHPTRSFNLGIPGLDALDADLLLRELAAAPPRGLRFVVIDPEGLGVLDPRVQTLDRRSIAAHEGPVLAPLAALVGRADAPLGRRLMQGSRHALAALYQSLNVSRCIPAVRRWIGSAPRRELALAELGPNRDGYFRAEDRARAGEARARLFDAQEQQRYVAEVERLVRGEAQDAPLGEEEAAVYALLRRRIEALGAVPIFLRSPGPSARRELRWLWREGRVPHLLDYGDPSAHPDLYRVEHRFDRRHLNARGAELFTRRLAADFAAGLGARTL